MKEDKTEDKNCYDTKGKKRMVKKTEYGVSVCREVCTMHKKQMMGKMEYPTIDMKRTGQNLKRIFDERQISVGELQSFLGLSCPQTVYHWFSGQAVPSVDNLFALSNLLKIPMEKLLVKRLFSGKNCLYFLMIEQPLVKEWEFIMRMMNYRSRSQHMMQAENR